MDRFGINLYSVRDLIKTEDGLKKTVGALIDAGYTYFQFSGAEFDADMIARVKNDCGAPFVLTHVSLDRIVNDTDALMRDHDKFGCVNIGLGSMPQKVLSDKEELKRTLEELERAGKKMKENGFKLFYHNHHMEFYKYDGKTIFDYMIENTPDINFTLDTYWVQYGGADVLSLLDKLDGRIDCVHLKDYKIRINDSGKFEPVFAPICKTPVLAFTVAMLLSETL